MAKVGRRTRVDVRVGDNTTVAVEYHEPPVVERPRLLQCLLDVPEATGPSVIGLDDPLDALGAYLLELLLEARHLC